MIFASLILLATTAQSAPLSVPAELTALADGIRVEKSRTKRIELLAGLQTDLKKRVGEIPDSVGEEELPRVQILYELNILLGSLKPETITPVTCTKVMQSMRQMANPHGRDETEISAAGRLALDVVKSVCAP